MTKRLFVIAGAALSLGTFAQAQTLDQSRAQSAELLADAGTRTSSLAPAAQDFTVNVHGYEQFRFNWNYRRDDVPEGNVEGKTKKNTIGFQNARTRLNFSGNIANENWGYFVQFGFGDAESGAIFEDAYGTYKMGNGWGFKWGQFKLPFSREELVGDTFQLFADRSVINSRYTGGRTQGIEFTYEGDQFHFAGSFNDGLQASNTDFTSGREADFGLSARAEWKWAGDWKQAKDFTSFQNSEYFGLLGGAIHYQDGGGTVGTMDARDLAATIDASVEGNGWNAFGAVIYNQFKQSGAAEGNLNDWAFQLQGGIFVSADWELIAGWDFLNPDSNYGARQDSKFQDLKIGVNHYFVPESHAAKLTIDLSYFLDKQAESAPAVPSTATGLLVSDKKNQWNLRAQMQLMF